MRNMIGIYLIEKIIKFNLTRVLIKNANLNTKPLNTRIQNESIQKIKYEIIGSMF